jgi:hypothetical protein
MTGLGLVSFTGNSKGDGAGGFGAGLSPVQLVQYYDHDSRGHRHPRS